MSAPLFSQRVVCWEDWSRVYRSIPAFTPLAREICRREGLPFAPLSPLTPAPTGCSAAGSLW